TGAGGRGAGNAAMARATKRADGGALGELAGDLERHRVAHALLHEEDEESKEEADEGRKNGGKLTAAARKHIAPKNFALPGGRYPIEDEGHAKAALSRAAHNATPEEQAAIRRKVHAKYPGMKMKDED